MNLKQWLTENRYSYQGFADLLLEKESIEVSRHAVQKWTLGHEPRPATREAIRKVTKGNVKPSDFL